jgi:chemotaxis protein MotB
MKRIVQEEHENHERWMVSWADLITLLFALFVVMYSVSRVDNKRLAQVAQSVKFAMHFKGEGGVSELPIFQGPVSDSACASNSLVKVDDGAPPAWRAEIRRAKAARSQLEKRLRPYLEKRAEAVPSVVVTTEGRRLLVRLSASRFFDAGLAAMRPEMIPVLDAIAEELAQINRPIRVEGYSDGAPGGGGRFRDKWDLSSSRASSVASYLERAHQIDESKLNAVGRGSANPIADASTEAGRELNRRIELVVEMDPIDARTAQ